MREIVIAALAATMLAGPAAASEWWQTMRSSNECFKSSVMGPQMDSPANFYESRVSLGRVMTIEDHGQLVEVCDVQTYTCVPFFRTREACEAWNALKDTTKRDEEKKLEPYR